MACTYWERQRDGEELTMPSASVQREDLETGESRLDHETGEEVTQSLVLPSHQRQTRDAETGEPEPQDKGELAGSRKRTFQIPKSALQPKKCDRIVCLKDETLPLTVQKTHTCCIEKEMERVSKNTSPILFMLPTLFLFPGWATVLCIVFELVSHAWAHKKNKLRKGLKTIYRSPLHLITSEFCAYCQSEKLMVKIGKLQDERKLKANRRKLPYCAYVEKMSVIT